MNRKKLNLLFLVFVLCVGFVVYLSLRNDYEKIIELFSQMSFLWFIFCIILLIIYYLLDVFFFKVAYSRVNPDYKFTDALLIQQLGNFFNLIDPFGGSGNAIEPIYLKKQKINVAYSTSIVMITFISYQLMLIILTTIIFVLYHSFDINPAIIPFIIIGFGINYVVIIGLMLVSVSSKAQRIITKLVNGILRRLKFIKSREAIAQNITDTIVDFHDNFRSVFKDKELMIYRLVTDFLKLVIYFSITFFAIKALNVGIHVNEFITCFVLTSFVYIISSITPTPGSVGGAEASFLLIFGSLLGASTTSVMLLWRFIVAYLPMIFGFIIFALSNRFIRKQ